MCADLCQALAGVSQTPGFAAVRDRAAALLAALRRHHALEVDLIFEAFWDRHWCRGLKAGRGRSRRCFCQVVHAATDRCQIEIWVGHFLQTDYELYLLRIGAAGQLAPGGEARCSASRGSWGLRAGESDRQLWHGLATEQRSAGGCDRGEPVGWHARGRHRAGDGARPARQHRTASRSRCCCRRASIVAGIVTISVRRKHPGGPDCIVHCE